MNLSLSCNWRLFFFLADVIGNIHGWKRENLPTSSASNTECTARKGNSNEEKKETNAGRQLITKIETITYMECAIEVIPWKTEVNAQGRPVAIIATSRSSTCFTSLDERRPSVFAVRWFYCIDFGLGKRRLKKWTRSSFDPLTVAFHQTGLHMSDKCEEITNTDNLSRRRSRRKWIVMTVEERIYSIAR